MREIERVRGIGKEIVREIERENERVKKLTEALALTSRLLPHSLHLTQL